MNFSEIKLRKIAGNEAPLGVCSIPTLPGRGDLSAEGYVVQTVPVGFWPERMVHHPRSIKLWQRHGWSEPAALPAGELWPRRQLTFIAPDKSFHSDSQASSPPSPNLPDVLSLTSGLTSGGLIPGAEFGAGDGSFSHWTVDVTEEAFVQRKDEQWSHTCADHNASLILGFKGQSCTLRFGWEERSTSEDNVPVIHAWEWANVQRLWTGPLAEGWMAGGHIYVGPHGARLANVTVEPWWESALTEERMVMVQVFFILFHYGAVDIRVHFVNGELYGRGGFVPGRPRITFETSDEISTSTAVKTRGWQIHATELKPFGGDSASAFTQEAGRLTWTPFTDTQQVLGRPAEKDGPGELIYAPETEDGFPRGTARTAHFGLTLNGAALPVRYLPKAEYMLLAGEWGVPLDPGAPSPAGVEGLENMTRATADVFLRNYVREGFCEGGVVRYLDNYPDGRWEFSGDGNETSSLFRGSYALQDAALYEMALRNADYGADLSCDHTQFIWHYHEAQPCREIYSLIYMRFAGLVYAHLETGDPYYLQTAEAVAGRWISTHRAHWPRRGIGRDAEPVEGILTLFDYTGQEHYLVAARRIARDVVASLYPNGAWTSGAGAGPFWGTNALPGIPWNGAHLISGLVDFLLRVTPEDPAWPELIDGGTRHLRHTLELLWGPDYNGFHRAALSYGWKRHYILALLSGENELQESILKALRGVLNRFHEEGEQFFKMGHHCAGYMDYPWFFLYWHSPDDSA